MAKSILSRFTPSNLSDVDTHSDTRGGPALDVKCQRFPIIHRAELGGVTEAAAQRAMELVWDATVGQFWAAAQIIADEVFGVGHEVFAVGRSGGWLTVRGLGKVADWDKVALVRWRRFARKIGELYNELIDPARIKQAIIDNKWADPDAALNNLILMGPGVSTTAAEVKRIRAQGAEAAEAAFMERLREVSKSAQARRISADSRGVEVSPAQVRVGEGWTAYSTHAGGTHGLTHLYKGKPTYGEPDAVLVIDCRSDLLAEEVGRMIDEAVRMRYPRASAGDALLGFVLDEGSAVHGTLLLNGKPAGRVSLPAESSAAAERARIVAALNRVPHYVPGGPIGPDVPHAPGCAMHTVSSAEFTCGKADAEMAAEEPEGKPAKRRRKLKS